MPGAVRFGDICSGHDGYPPRVNDQASTNVFINGLGAHRVGDSWEEHCNGGCHIGYQETGSPNVFVNSKSLARIGDDITCGSTNVGGSTNVFING